MKWFIIFGYIIAFILFSMFTVEFGAVIFAIGIPLGLIGVIYLFINDKNK